MKRKILLVLLLGILGLGLTGCGGLKESDLVGKKYVENNPNCTYCTHWEFKTEGVVYRYDIYNSYEKANQLTGTYKTDHGNIILIQSGYDGNTFDKWEVSEDFKTITRIGDNLQMVLTN